MQCTRLATGLSSCDPSNFDAAAGHGCNLWRNRVKLLSFSEQLNKPYLEGMRRTETGDWVIGGAGFPTGET